MKNPFRRGEFYNRYNFLFGSYLAYKPNPWRKVWIAGAIVLVGALLGLAIANNSTSAYECYLITGGSGACESL